MSCPGCMLVLISVAVLLAGACTRVRRSDGGMIYWGP